MLQNYAANLHKGVPAGAFPHKLNACSFHYTTDCAALFSLTYVTAKDYYRLFEFLIDTLLQMQREVLINTGPFKILKQGFKKFKPEVLKATSFRR